MVPKSAYAARSRNYDIKKRTSGLSPGQKLTLKTEHFSRWAGCASQATGMSPLFLSGREVLNHRGSLKSQVQNTTINVQENPEITADN